MSHITTDQDHKLKVFSVIKYRFKRSVFSPTVNVAKTLPNNYFSLFALCSRKEKDPNWRNSKKIQIRLRTKVKPPESEVNFMNCLLSITFVIRQAPQRAILNSRNSTDRFDIRKGLLKVPRCAVATHAI